MKTVEACHTAYGVRSRLLMAYEIRPYFFLFQPHEIDMPTTN